MTGPGAPHVFAFDRRSELPGKILCGSVRYWFPTGGVFEMNAPGYFSPLAS